MRDLSPISHNLTASQASKTGVWQVALSSQIAMACIGAITCDTDISHGIQTAPHAVADLFAGTNTGKKLIQIT